MLISSFLGLGVGSDRGEDKKVAVWMAASSAADQRCMAADCPFHHAADVLPRRAGSTHLRPQLVRYVSLVGIFVSNAIVFVPLGQRIGSLFEALPAFTRLLLGLGRQPCGDAVFRCFLAEVLFADAGNGIRGFRRSFCCFRAGSGCDQSRSWFCRWRGVFFGQSECSSWSPYYYIVVVLQGDKHGNAPVREPHPGLRTMQDPPHLQCEGKSLFSSERRHLRPEPVFSAEESRDSRREIAIRPAVCAGSGPPTSTHVRGGRRHGHTDCGAERSRTGGCGGNRSDVSEAIEPIQCFGNLRESEGSCPRRRCPSFSSAFKRRIRHGGLRLL